MKIYCCGCEREVTARQVYGNEIYPHREDLHMLPFWKCDSCGNFVGCHYQTKNATAPLGCIPTAEIKKARKRIHKVLDPIWESGKMSRKEVYALISAGIGRQYHTAELRSVTEADEICQMLNFTRRMK